LQSDLAKRQKQIDDRLEKRKIAGKAEKVVKMAQKTRDVLDEFIRKLAPEKLHLLKNSFSTIYEKLMRYEDPVSEIDIDEESWQIILKDNKGRPLEKRVFSAGMKEIYALSLLWALSQSSGKELPVVIDTPVGRLDSTNRRALFEKYLPYAGHQVIVLSTDREVDVEWAKRLSPFVAKQYRLDYDRKKRSTIVRTGYFF